MTRDEALDLANQAIDNESVLSEAELQAIQFWLDNEEYGTAEMLAMTIPSLLRTLRYYQEKASVHMA